MRYSPEVSEKTPIKELDKVFRGNTFSLKQRFFRLRRTFDIADEQGNVLMKAKKKVFAITRQFQLTDKEESKELLSFETRGSIPEMYDVTDGKDKVGVIKHNPLKSAIHTNWSILSPDGEEVLGTIKRNGVFNYEITTSEGESVAVMKRQVSFVGVKLTMQVQNDDSPIDRRLLVAANVIMAERAAERRNKRKDAAIIG